MTDFDDEVAARIANNGADEQLRLAADQFTLASVAPKYSYNFSWLGRPIIQYPQDVMAMQELVWSVRPDLIVETGIAHGGSLIFYASMLELLTLAGGREDALVLGIDVDIRSHNRVAIEAHPLSPRIAMIEGSSTSPDVVRKVHQIAVNYQTVLLTLDSNHTHDHVLAELEAYAGLVSVGSYCVVFDTIIEDLPSGTYPDRPWHPGNSPKSAIAEFLRTHHEFAPESSIDSKLLISMAPGGYLRRTR